MLLPQLVTKSPNLGGQHFCDHMDFCLHFCILVSGLTECCEWTSHLASPWGLWPPYVTVWVYRLPVCVNKPSLVDVRNIQTCREFLQESVWAKLMTVAGKQDFKCSPERQFAASFTHLKLRREGRLKEGGRKQGGTGLFAGYLTRLCALLGWDYF